MQVTAVGDVGYEKSCRTLRIRERRRLRVISSRKSAVVAHGKTLPVGAVCNFHDSSGCVRSAQVVERGEAWATLVPMENIVPEPGAAIECVQRIHSFPAGVELLGRTLDPLGAPVDGKGPVGATRYVYPFDQWHPTLDWSLKQFATGVRAVDGLFPVRVGSLAGVVASSRVVVTDFMAHVAGASGADVAVVCLLDAEAAEIRRVAELLDAFDCASRTVVVTSTASSSPVLNLDAAMAASALAVDFARLGSQTAFMLCSAERLAAVCCRIERACRGGENGSRFWKKTLGTIRWRCGHAGLASVTGWIGFVAGNGAGFDAVAAGAFKHLDARLKLVGPDAAWGNEGGSGFTVDPENSFSQYGDFFAGEGYGLRLKKVRRLWSAYRGGRSGDYSVLFRLLHQLHGEGSTVSDAAAALGRLYVVGGAVEEEQRARAA